jgi:hypothetical protein
MHSLCDGPKNLFEIFSQKISIRCQLFENGNNTSTCSSNYWHFWHKCGVSRVKMWQSFNCGFCHLEMLLFKKLKMTKLMTNFQFLNNFKIYEFYATFNSFKVIYINLNNDFLCIFSIFYAAVSMTKLKSKITSCLLLSVALTATV